MFFLPVACSYVVASLIWKMSIFNGVRFGLANTVLRALGFDGRQWLSRPHPPLYWVVIVSERLWLQVGFYMILFLAGLQRIPRRSTRRPRSTGRERMADVPLHHVAAAAGDVGGGARAAADQRLPGVRRVLQPAVQPRPGTYPPYARPPLVYLYYIALGRQQDFGHGSAGAVILTLLIAIFTLVQGRLVGFGRRGSYG